jgi:hypothetical protein
MMRGNAVATKSRSGRASDDDDDRTGARGCATRPDPKSPIADDRGRQKRETPLSSERGAGGADGT